MENRKMATRMLKGLLMAVVGISAFTLGILIDNLLISGQQEHEHEEAPSMHSTVSSAQVVSSNQERESTADDQERESNSDEPQPDTSSVRASIPSNDREGNLQSDSDHYKEDSGAEESMEERCLALMHERGWYKPEDIPIIYEPPARINPSPGVYMWRKGSLGNVKQSAKRPPHVEAKIREISNELEKAVDGKERLALIKELTEINRPYSRAIKLKMFLDNIPESWAPYFNELFDAEKEKMTTEAGIVYD